MKITFVKRNKSEKDPNGDPMDLREGEASELGAVLPPPKTLTTQMLFLGNDKLVANQGYLSHAQVLY